MYIPDWVQYYKGKDSMRPKENSPQSLTSTLRIGMECGGRGVRKKKVEKNDGSTNSSNGSQPNTKPKYSQGKDSNRTGKKTWKNGHLRGTRYGTSSQIKGKIKVRGSKKKERGEKKLGR